MPDNLPNEQSATPQETKWEDAIPSEYANEKYWEPLKGKPISDVLKSYANQQKLIGGKTVYDLPPEDDADSWKAFNEKLGIPETPDEYELKTREIPGFQWDETELQSLKETAKEIKLSKTQAEKLMDWFQDSTERGLQKVTSSANDLYAQNEVALKRDLGSNYDVDTAFAKRAVVHYFGEELGPQIWEASLANRPVADGWIKAGKQLRESKVLSGEKVELEGYMTAEKAQQKINTILTNSDHRYFQAKPTDPDYKQVQDEVANLFRIANPQQG